MATITFKTNQDPFYEELKQEVYGKIKEDDLSHYAGKPLKFKALFWGLLCLTSYLGVLFAPIGAWAKLFIALIFGFTLFFFIINTCHDVVHQSWSKNKYENAFFKVFIFNLLGVDGDLWSLRHVKSHHLFPNVKGCDADIDETAIIRLSPNAKHYWFHNYQHIYGVFVYSILAAHSVFYQDFTYLFKTELANLKNIKITRAKVASFIFYKFLYFMVWLILPVLFSGLAFWQVFLGYLIVSVPMSLLFMPIGLTHLNEHTMHVNPENDPIIPASFARYQILSSIDFAPKSKFAAFFYGGLNTHAAHHLFPKLTHEHYYWITELIVKKCKKYEVPYKSLGFIEMWISHIKYLKEVGKTPVENTKPDYEWSFS